MCVDRGMRYDELLTV